MRVRAVLFDLGGTLLHYRREEVLHALLKEKGLSTDVDEILRAYDAIDPVWSELTADLPQQYMWPDSMLEQFDGLILEHLGIEKVGGSMARFVRENWDRMDRQLPQHILRKPFGDVLPCLNRLDELKMKMGIVSNIPSDERLRTEIKAIELSRFFPVLIASGTSGVAKPNRLIFETAAKMIEEDLEKILFVGDDPAKDYEGALLSGMKSLLIDRRGLFRNRKDLCRISSLEEVPPLLAC